jgi:hypothetical protein
MGEWAFVLSSFLERHLRPFGARDRVSLPELHLATEREHLLYLSMLRGFLWVRKQFEW